MMRLSRSPAWRHAVRRAATRGLATGALLGSASAFAPNSAAAQDAARTPASAPSCAAPVLAPRATGGPQVADTGFRPPLPAPAFTSGSAPLVLLDEAHNNFHTVDGRYSTFARILRSDGLRVEPLRDRFTAASLARANVLVIANAVADRNRNSVDWTLPTPSAFAPDEIAALKTWVEGGGALLVIADHMPFGGAAEELAAAFGIVMSNGYATDSTCSADEFHFTRANGLLGDHPITRGRTSAERVTAVRSFTGQAFSVSGAFAPLLTVPAGAVSLLPSRAWEFTGATPRVPAGGRSQGAALIVGRGRVAVFGEAAMFTAQVSGAVRRPMGMNDPGARENPQFLLNVLHWLTGVLPAR
jgi:hypothetical protein